MDAPDDLQERFVQRAVDSMTVYLRRYRDLTAAIQPILDAHPEFADRPGTIHYLHCEEE